MFDDGAPVAVEPLDGAGVAADDPPQDGVPQYPAVAVAGDVDVLPEVW